MNAVLTLDQLSCVRGERTLFSAVSRELRGGGLLHVLGANGAGKTSLLRMLCGLLTPASGQVRWRGQPLLHSREALGRAGRHGPAWGRRRLRLAGGMAVPSPA